MITVRITQLYLSNELTNLQTYGSLTVQWTTHNPHGLSNKDTIMAKYCDEEAKSIGTVKQSEGQRCGPAPSAQ
jgi:hypothetical protein